MTTLPTLASKGTRKRVDMARELSIADTQRLLERVRIGDREAEGHLFGALEGVLRQEARQHRLMPAVRRRCSEEDVVHEAWVRFCASGSLGAFEHRGPGSLRRYLGVILDRTLVDMVRRERADKREWGSNPRSLDATRERHDAHRGSPKLEAKDPTPTSRVRAAELRRICRKVLEPHEYEVWRKVDVDGCTSVEAAQELGTSSAAVRGILHRARLKLLKNMDEGRARR